MVGACVASALTAVTAVAQTYQLPNIGFENWESSKKSFLTANSDGASEQRPGTEPTDWNSSNVKCTLISFSLVQQDTYNSSKCAKVVNKKVGSAWDQYVPYTGLISLGNTWYTIWWNWTGVAPSTSAGRNGNAYAQNGSYGGVSFAGRPDAIAGDFASTTRADNEVAHVITYLWKGSFTGQVPGELGSNKISSWKTVENVDRAIWGTIDPSIVTDATIKNIDASNGVIVAYCDKQFSNTFDWINIEIPLTYVSSETPEMANVMIVAGNPWDSRVAVAENNLFADNVRYVYYSRLKSASLSDGYSVDFDPNTFDYVFTVEDPSAVTLPTVDYAVMSNDALTAEKTVTVNSDDDNKLVSVKVANNAYAAGNTDATDVDGLGEHTYTFYFRKASETLNGYYFTNVADAATDVVSGETTTLTLEQNKANLNYTATLSNVVVAEGASAVNIVFPDVEITEENGVRTFTGKADAKIGDETKSVVVSGEINEDGTFEIKFSYLNASGENVVVVFTPDVKTSAVTKVKDTKTYVSAASGKISVAGYNGNVEVFTIDGRMVANTACQGFADINVANGLYIVRTGNKTTKVVVK